MKRPRMEYIDTSALIALSDKGDISHVEAVNISENR
jgi:predicted nucleic acid-binding protein